MFEIFEVDTGVNGNYTTGEMTIVINCSTKVSQVSGIISSCSRGFKMTTFGGHREMFFLF